MQREAWFVVGSIVIVALMALAGRDARVHRVEREGSKLSRTDVPRAGKKAQ